jgi:pantoate--beta-alanine ligase
VVAKLFNISDPDAAYFGQKDWQQAMVLRRMVRDLDLDIDMVICPTYREADGLAMSSRNALLSGAEREAAPFLHRALQEGASMAREGDRSAARITRRVEERLADTSFRLQYVEALGARDLQRREILTGEVVLAAAAFLGSTRLIDNVLIDLPPEEQPT